MVRMLSESNSHTETYKFRLPILIKRTNSHLTLTSGAASFKATTIDDFDSLYLKGVDPDGFVIFDVGTRSDTVQDSSNGYRLFHSEKSAMKGKAEKASTYEYYKRDRDGTYAFVVASKGGRSPKHHLGNPMDSKSPIGQVLSMCPEGEWFLRTKLPNDFARDNAQICKASFDILSKEGILQRKQKPDSKRLVYEYFRSPAKQPTIEDLLTTN